MRLPSNSSNRGRYLIVIVVIVVAVLVAIWVVRRQNTGSTTNLPTISGDLVISPKSSQRLTWRTTATIHPVRISLPRGQLDQTDWYLPITNDSNVGYVLHDGQSRWLVAGRRANIESMPTDPVQTLVAAPNGLSLSWPTDTGIAVASASDLQPRTIDRATSPFFSSQSQLDYILPGDNSTSFVAVEGTHRYPLSNVGALFAHPFLSDGVAFDNHGRLGWIQVDTGSVQSIAAVNPEKWASPLDAGSIAGGTYFMLSQDTPVPSYLLIIDQAGSVHYYAWKSPIVPEVAVDHGVLALTDIKSGSQLVVVGGDQLTPLSVYPSVFSAGPMGLVWQAPNASFLRLPTLP